MADLANDFKPERLGGKRKKSIGAAGEAGLSGVKLQNR